MAISDHSYLNSSIPGMSLTTEPGNRPWESPPQMATIEEAIQYYTAAIFGASEIARDDLLDILEAQIPIRNMANIMQTTSVMQGKHTLDVGFLVAPVIEELLMALCDVHGVKFLRSENDLIKENYVTRRQTRKALEAAKKEQAMQEETVATPDLESAATGLMARKPAAPVEEQMPEVPMNEMGA